MIKRVGQQFCKQTVMGWRRAQSHIRELWIYCSTVSKGWVFHCQISTFPSDVPTRVWRLQWKRQWRHYFLHLHFSCHRQEGGYSHWANSAKEVEEDAVKVLWRCWSQAVFCLLIAQEDKNRVKRATEGKGVYDGLLLSDYCVQDVLKFSPGLPPFISPQGCEGRTKY